MKPKHKFLLAFCCIFATCCAILIGFICYILSLIFSSSPLPPYKFNVTQKNLLTASQKINEHYNKLINPPTNTEEIELTCSEVDAMLMLSSKYITNTINVKRNNSKNYFCLYVTDQKYHVRLSYFLSNFLPFGNYINISATLNFSIKDHKNHIQVLAAKCGDINIPLSFAQEKAETYLNADMKGNKEVLQIIKSLNWHNKILRVTYYPKEILALILKYQSLINSDNTNDSNQLPENQ